MTDRQKTALTEYTALKSFMCRTDHVKIDPWFVNVLDALAAELEQALSDNDEHCRDYQEMGALFSNAADSADKLAAALQEIKKHKYDHTWPEESKRIISKIVDKALAEYEKGGE